MRKWLALALGLALSLPLLAEEQARALFKESWGGVYCQPGVRQVPDQTGNRTLLHTEAGPVTITKSGFGYVFQFPKWSATVQEQVDGSVRVRFGPDTFLFRRSKTLFEAQLPRERIRYTLTGGRVTAIHGQQGSVNIRTTFSTNTYTIYGPNGKTRLQLQPRGKQNAVVVLEGEPVEQIPYLVQGFRLEDPATGVGIFIAVPGGKLTQAMPWKQAYVYNPPVPNPVPVEEAREPNPLQAVTSRDSSLNAVIGSPQNLQGRFAPPGEDHLKVRHDSTGADHLKANLGDPDEDPLQVRQHNRRPEITPPVGSPRKSNSAPSTPPPANVPHDDAEDDLIVK